MVSPWLWAVCSAVVGQTPTQQVLDAAHSLETAIVEAERAEETSEWHNRCRPTFQTSAELEAHPWAKQYLLNVYGEVPGDDGFPISLERMSWFYINHLPEECVPAERPSWEDFDEADKQIQPGTVFSMWSGRNSAAEHTMGITYPFNADGGYDTALIPGRFDAENRYQRFDGFPDGTLVEVFHCSFSGDGNNFWLYHAPGSGVFFNLGKTKILDDKGADIFDVAYEAAGLRDEGFESIQIPRHKEGSVWSYEILDLRTIAAEDEATQRSCPNANGIGSYGCGWGGQNACECNPERSCLNCGMAANKAGDWCPQGSGFRCPSASLMCPNDPATSAWNCPATIRVDQSDDL